MTLKSTPFTAIDLFCGAGGLTEGLKQAGFTVLAGIELDKHAAHTYRLNHKNTICYERNIKDIQIEELLKDLNLKPGDLGLLAGCPPCQGFSALRTRNKSISFFDERNDLIFEFLRIVEGLLPKCIMLENVPALIKDQRTVVVVNKLKKLGYIFDEDSLKVEDVSKFGVPQRRKRMILKASRKGIVGSALISEKKTVRQSLCEANLGLPTKSSDHLHNYIQKRSNKVNEIIKNIPKNGGGRLDLPDHLILDCHRNRPNQFTDVYGRMKWDDVAPTITGGCTSPSKGRFLHPEEDRCITLREAAILQTFPKSYKFPVISQAAIALMIGNALPPEFIKRQATSFKKLLDIS